MELLQTSEERIRHLEALVREAKKAGALNETTDASNCTARALDPTYDRHQYSSIWGLSTVGDGQATGRLSSASGWVPSDMDPMPWMQVSC